MSGPAQRARIGLSLLSLRRAMNIYASFCLSVCLPTAPSPALFICLSAACIYSHSAKKFALAITHANTDPCLKLSRLLHLQFFIPTKAK